MQVIPSTLPYFKELLSFRVEVIGWHPPRGVKGDRAPCIRQYSELLSNLCFYIIVILPYNFLGTSHAILCHMCVLEGERNPSIPKSSWSVMQRYSKQLCCICYNTILSYAYNTGNFSHYLSKSDCDNFGTDGFLPPSSASSVGIIPWNPPNPHIHCPDSREGHERYKGNYPIPIGTKIVAKRGVSSA